MRWYVWFKLLKYDKYQTCGRVINEAGNQQGKSTMNEYTDCDICNVFTFFESDPLNLSSDLTEYKAQGC